MTRDSKGRFAKAQAALWINAEDNQPEENIEDSLLGDFLKAFGVALLILIVIGTICAVGCMIR